MTFSYHRIAEGKEASASTANIFTHDDTNRTHQPALPNPENALTLFAIPTSHRRFVRLSAGREPRQRHPKGDPVTVTVPADRRSGCHFAHSAISVLELWCRTFPVFVARRCYRGTPCM